MFSSLKKFPERNFGKSSKPAEKNVGPVHELLTGGDFSLSRFTPLIEGRFIEVDENLQLADQSGDITVTTIALAVIIEGSLIPAMLFAEDGSSEKELKMRRIYPIWRLRCSMDEDTCILRVMTGKGVFNYKLLVPVEADLDYVSRWVMIVSLMDDYYTVAGPLHTCSDRRVPSPAPPQPDQSCEEGASDRSCAHDCWAFFKSIK